MMKMSNELEVTEETTDKRQMLVTGGGMFSNSQTVFFIRAGRVVDVDKLCSIRKEKGKVFPAPRVKKNARLRSH